ncbi:MAG: baseplate J/gp47 family protein, partial [Leptospira sp.]|nr:baseplate J/gp47 family protein [Leptospira sp.]
PLGSERQGPKNSIVDLEFFGEDDSLIKSGTISGTPSGVLFITIEAKTIISESISVKARAIESGTSGNVAANSITEILTPLTGIDSVNNPEPAIGGRVRETDTEYFNRFMEQGSEGGSSAVGIQSALNNIQSILSAIVYENETDFEDEAGRPPHSMEAVIEGGTAEEIADLFVKKWPGGIESFGEESATIIDNKGQTRTYYYNIPEEVTIYVKIEIEKDLDVWVPGSESIVKSNCIKVVGGIDTIGDVSTNYKGNGTGKNLFSWELIAAQRGLTEYNSVKVLGIKAINAFVDTESPASEDTVIISGRQKPKLITANVTVNFL